MSGVFIIGCANLFLFLYKQGKWRTLPLLLMYISGQMTLAFAIVRLSLPSQPSSLATGEFDYMTYLYVDSFSMSWMWCVGVSQLVTLIELTLKTCSISTHLARVQGQHNTFKPSY